MRRLKGSPVLSGSLNPLAAAIGTTNVVAFPGVGFTPTRAEAPPAMVTVGNTALAVDYQQEPEVETSEEPAEGSGQRPEGVSDQVLLEAWHRLHTPYASVAGTKRKGVTRRVNVATSGTHKPKAYSPSLLTTVQVPSANVVSLQQTLNGLLKAAESRYINDHKNQAVDFIDPRAEKYVLDRHAEKVNVWKPLIAMYQQAAEISHASYDFAMAIEKRRLEWDDVPLQLEDFDQPESLYNYKPQGFVGPVQEQPAANDDASVVVVEDRYIVGPSGRLPCLNDVPIRSWDDWYNIKQREYAARHRELEEAFNAHDYEQNVVSSKYRLPAEMPTTHQDIPERSYVSYKNAKDYYHGIKQAMYEELWAAEDLRLKNVRMLAETYAKFKRFKWRAAPEFLLKMRSAHNEFMNASHRLATYANEWTTQYKRKLKALRSKNVRTRSYEAIPFSSFLSLYQEGHDLQQGEHKVVATLGKQRPATVWSDQALSRVFSKVVASVNEAKAMLRAEVSHAKRVIFGEVEYGLTNSGVLLPVNLVELPPEPGW